MHVRLADTNADFPAILAGAQNFVSRMDFTAHLPLDDAGLAAALARVFALDGIDILIAEAEGRIIGGLGMLYAPYVWNPALMAGEELFFWTTPGAPPAAALNLIRSVQRRAVAKHAHIMNFAALTSSPPALGRIYERLGMRKTQTTYTGVI